MKVERTSDRMTITDEIVAVNGWAAKLNDHAGPSTQVRCGIVGRNVDGRIRPSYGLHSGLVHAFGERQPLTVPNPISGHRRASSSRPGIMHDFVRFGASAALSMGTDARQLATEPAGRRVPVSTKPVRWHQNAALG
jgi:hypothetical protein